MDIFQWYELSRSRSGTAIWAANTAFGMTYQSLGFSTRNGNMVVDWRDGTVQNISPIRNTDATSFGSGGAAVLTFLSHTYASTFIGDISLKFLNGLKDVYSINIGGSAFYLNQTWQSFISQFTNLFSVRIDQPHNGYSNFSGDISIMPDSVEKFVILDLRNTGNLTLNFSNFSTTSKLKTLQIGGGKYVANTFGIVTGDLAKIPHGVTLFRFYYANAGSAITYTAGKVWASNLETLSIPLPLTTSELDNMLIDMENSVTSVGAGTYALGGFRSVVSDAAVAYLEGLGRTVSINRILNDVSLTDSALLRLDLQNNFDVYSNSGLNIAAGVISNQPIFALSGRKAGEYCAVFNGSQSIKTTTNLPINSDKVTVKFWIKTSETNAFVLATGNAAPTSSNRFFDVIINAANVMRVRCGNTDAIASFVNDEWTRYAITIDKSLTANETKIYKNGAFHVQSTGNITGDFVNEILYIGQRGGSTTSLDAYLMHLEISNYPITATEALADYNSFL